MAHLLRRSALIAGVAGFILCVSLSGASARIEQVKLSNVLSEGNAALCEEDFPSDARATLFLKQTRGQTWLTIIVHNARPHALFTVWLFLSGLSPLTGVDAMPMVRSDLVDDLVEVTPPVGFEFGLQNPPFDSEDGDTTVYMTSTGPTGPGFGTRSLIPNGFYTNRSGWGIFTTHLDFALVDGSYPFDKVEIPGRVAQGDFQPVPILPDFPFGIVSHCKDEKAHGLVNRANDATGDQPWFFYEPRGRAH